MAEWTLWAALFTLGTALAMVALYLICRRLGGALVLWDSLG